MLLFRSTSDPFEQIPQILFYTWFGVLAGLLVLLGSSMHLQRSLEHPAPTQPEASHGVGRGSPRSSGVSPTHGSMIRSAGMPMPF